MDRYHGIIVVVLTHVKLASLFLIAAVLSGDDNSTKYSTRMGDFDQETIIQIQEIVSEQVSFNKHCSRVELITTGCKSNEKQISFHGCRREARNFSGNSRSRSCSRRRTC